MYTTGWRLLYEDRNSYDMKQETCRLVPEAHVPKITFVLFLAAPTGFKYAAPAIRYMDMKVGRHVNSPRPTKSPLVDVIIIIIMYYYYYYCYYCY